LLIKNIIKKYYPKDLIEKMKKSIKDENDPTFREFKSKMESLAGSGLFMVVIYWISIFSGALLYAFHIY